MDQQVRELQQQVAQAPDQPGLRARYQTALLRSRSLADCEARLAELERWDAADPIEQDAVMAWVAHVDPGLAWRGAETFRCGGQLHRVGVFAHARSGIVFHLVPGGEYLRGTADPEAELALWRARGSDEEELAFLQDSLRDEVPAHRAAVRPFLLAREPITEGQWSRGPKLSRPRQPRWNGDDVEPSPDVPRVDIEVTFFEIWTHHAGVRLPREVEWEWACRAGSASRFFWGDDVDPARFWSFAPDVRPCVAEHANAFGLRDLVGNAWEACADRFHGDGEGVILRGGLNRSPTAYRSAQRTRLFRSEYYLIACRPVLDLRLDLPALRVFGAVSVELVSGERTECAAPAAPCERRVRLRRRPVLPGSLGQTQLELEMPPETVVNYHAALVRHLQLGGPSPETVRETARAFLAIAKEARVPTLTLPLLRTGAGGLSVARSLEATLCTLEELAPQLVEPLTVEVVVLDDDLEQALAAFDAFRGRSAREAREAKLALDSMDELLRRPEDGGGGPAS